MNILVFPGPGFVAVNYVVAQQSRVVYECIRFRF